MWVMIIWSLSSLSITLCSISWRVLATSSSWYTTFSSVIFTSGLSFRYVIPLITFWDGRRCSSPTWVLSSIEFSRMLDWDCCWVNLDWFIWHKLNYWTILTFLADLPILVPLVEGSLSTFSFSVTNTSVSIFALMSRISVLTGFIFDSQHKTTESFPPEIK